ncbi:MAG: hypothetical protein GPJ54_20390 [Candidatus Heimdallarchaeota archaeon]|nr:hypothetical protein [Candidatus Heimdallarchaeota archaeon]
MRNKIIYILFIILLFASPSYAKTRNASVHNFFDEVRLSPEGFANSISDEVNIDISTKVLAISRLVDYEVNNTLDILLFYQRSQNEDGGFGENPEAESSWDTTVTAIQGLIELNVNSSQLATWKIDQYLNTSANELFYSTVIENNQTVIKNNDLTIDLIKKWGEYIRSSILIKVIPPIPNVFLGSELKSLQLSNGTYNNFEAAIQTVGLLAMLAQEPEDAELASKFIRAYATSNGMFSSTLNDPPNLKATYEAINALNSIDKLGELENKKEIILKILDLQKADSGFTDIASTEVNVSSTWYAINILWLLDSLDELLSPDVLQTQGFVGIGLISPIIGIVSFIFIRRKLK